jgi:hypothetical protein
MFVTLTVIDDFLLASEMQISHIALCFRMSEYEGATS